MVPTRQFGSTSLRVSTVGFGAWAIGGPAMAGDMALGWGDTDDGLSRRALERAADEGITFVDTADFYGFGHSEALIGEVFGNRPDIVVATKVGQRIADDGKSVAHDYSKAYVLRACEASLRRLRREAIDFYQLHTARVPHLEQGEAVEAMQQLRAEGKVRYWGVSLATFKPEPEAEWLLSRGLGHGVQLVLNVINQRAVSLLDRLSAAGHGVIARMPFQFGLLTGRVHAGSRFDARDHRSFRLAPRLLERALPVLEREVWPLAAESGISPASLALSFPASFESVSTVIPGIRTPEQATDNAGHLRQLPTELRDGLCRLYSDGPLSALMNDVEDCG